MCHLLFRSQTVNMECVIPFKPCSTFAIVGPTKSGKSYWLYRFIQNIDYMFEDETPNKVLYCYGVYQPLFDEIKEKCPFVEFHEGLPSEETINEFAGLTHRIVILDDLLDQVVRSKEMERLFILGSHHKKLSVFFLAQNLFAQGQCARTIALNTAYLILFKNYRDSSQLITLGRQIAPGNHNALVEAYKDATSLTSHGYLCIDLSVNSVDRFRWRTRVFPNEDPIIYEV